MIADSFTTNLTAVAIDHFHFRTTRNPYKRNSCILWFRNSHRGRAFEALGEFSRFEKRKVLSFIARYSTSKELRQEIEKRRFRARIENLRPSFFRSLERMRSAQKEAAFRNLFNLDSMIEQPSLDAKRRIIAKKLHPDAGGSDRYMTVVNEAFEHLRSRQGTHPPCC